jgi:hypothetical protein
MNNKISKNKNYKRANRKQNNIRNTNNSTFKITTINNTPIQQRCLRYSGTITSSTAVTSDGLLGLLVGTTNSSTATSNIFQSFRLIRVGITCLPSSATNSGTIAYSWVTDTDERLPATKETMYFSQGVPCKKNFYPPENSLAGNWLDDSNAQLFTIDPSDSVVRLIVDIQFDYVLAEGSSPGSALASAATFTGIGARYLDWASGGSDELIPVDMNLVN